MKKKPADIEERQTLRQRDRQTLRKRDQQTLKKRDQQILKRPTDVGVKGGGTWLKTGLIME